MSTKLYYSYIHCYLNYANMEWGSTHKIKLHKVHLKQKHAVRLICNESKFTHTKPFMGSIQVLNVFQVNIQKIMFMCSCIFPKPVVMHQVFLQKKLPIPLIDTQQTSRKTTLHYLNI